MGWCTSAMGSCPPPPATHDDKPVRRFCPPSSLFPGVHGELVGVGVAGPTAETAGSRLVFVAEGYNALLGRKKHEKDPEKPEEEEGECRRLCCRR